MISARREVSMRNFGRFSKTHGSRAEQEIILRLLKSSSSIVSKKRGRKIPACLSTTKK
ncbi:Hypothetical protein FKW44_006482 [Caligus rogercresseyi]|uniref:Uncharacterized protein n=1 Tax=Caligus rogercresseyi TaxID=217165 RepID=A0A7T8QSX8_CALRO|nr:Hypothetical protein FKW44_006482 [Caligus rogercresseyi]